MIRAGVFGSGSILKNALEIFREHNGFLITGYYSSDPSSDENLIIQQFKKPEELISVSEAIIITNNPGDFHELIPQVLKNSRHLLMFPDQTYSFNQLEIMLKLAEEADVIIYLHQDGIKDWMKEVVLTHCGKPEFIDYYSFINKNKSIPGMSVFDCLYRAISTVIKLNPVNVRKFYTNLVPYCSPDPIMTNVRLEFENGTSANITINGFFERNETKIEVFRNQCEVIINPLSPELSVLYKNPNSVRKFSAPSNETIDIFQKGLEAFALRLFSPALNNDPFEAGIITHKVATRIIHQFIPCQVRIL